MAARAAFLLTLGALLLPLPARATTTLTAGVQDGFAAPPDAVAPSAALTAHMNLFGGAQSYDQTAGLNAGFADRQVAHTFLFPGVNVASATLRFRVRGGNNAGVTNDGFTLSVVVSPTGNYADSIVCWRTFGPFGGGGSWFTTPDPGIVGHWAAGTDTTLTLNLAQVPLAGGGFLDVRPHLNARGRLDLVISDESAVDYAELVLEEVPPVPLASVLIVTALGAALLTIGSLSLRTRPRISE
jgi:hypothetical protein